MPFLFLNKYMMTTLHDWPDVITNSDKTSLSDLSLLEKMSNGAQFLIERGYPIQNMDEYALTQHLMNIKNDNAEH
jgi:uncharacterized surface anchored protein